MKKEKGEKKKINVFSLILKIIRTIILIIIILIPLSLGAIIYLNAPVHEGELPLLSETDTIRRGEDGSFLVDVRRGETSQSVGLRLERAGLIKSRYFWNVICRISSEPVKAGTYRLSLPANPLYIFRTLVSGVEVTYKVTIPEGVTLNKTALIFEEAGICASGDFLAAAHNSAILNKYGIPNDSMEGYLFPDTYLFPASYPADQVVMKMADNFFHQLENINPLIRAMTIDEINNIVILASIIEREYRAADEAPLMAGVFLNRLRINMALQSCATVVYIITEIQRKPHPSVLYYSDLEIRDPYNTYIYPGLPPGPISAPGVVALSAVINPVRTDYLYFRLTDPANGRHYFSRTYDDHIRAGELLIKP